MTEIWKLIDGFDGMYEVSDLGNVRSHYRHGCRTGTADIPHPVNQHAKNRGYMYVTLAHQGKVFHHYVHRLVASAFLGDASFSNATVNHKDMDKRNNRMDNLEYMTRGDNVRHSIGGYERPKGEAWHSSKLTDDDIRQIRAARDAGMHLKNLAKAFGVSVAAVHKIVRRETWKHVQ